MGLINVPFLILLGLPPQAAIGTHKLSVTGTVISGWAEFHRKKLVDYKSAAFLGIPFLLGSLIGATIVIEMSEQVLKMVIASIIFIVLALMLFKPSLGMKKTKKKVGKRNYAAALFLSLVIGVYNGFYGASAGTLISYILILIFGQTFVESAATRKALMGIAAFAVAGIFAYAGLVDYSIGIPLLIGSTIGSYFGAHHSEAIGNKWVKWIFILVALAMAAKLLL